MKKQLLLLVMMLLPMVSSAYDAHIDGIYYNLDKEAKTATVTYRSNNYYSGEVVIPNEITYRNEKYSVTCIGDYAFSNCSSLTSITIPNSVTSIGNCTFSDCVGLTSVAIPNSVTSIGVLAFDRTGWYNAQPDGILYLENWLIGYKGSQPTGDIKIKNGTCGVAGSAFRDCTSLTSVTIPNSVTFISIDAFSGCAGLTSFTIPNSITSIGDGAFLGCTGLTSITIPTSVISIGKMAFSRCSGLTSIIVDQNNVIYDSRENCNALIETATNTLLSGCNNTAIPNSVVSIRESAFEGCSNLISINIPNSVTSIRNYTFAGCLGLTSIDIPNSITSIGDFAFDCCSGLTSIIFPYSMVSIGGSAFNGCRIENVLAKNSKTQSYHAFSDRTYQHAMLYIPEGTWGEAVYDGDWYMFNNIRETTMKTDDLSPSRAYSLMDTKTFGYAVYDGTNDEVKIVKAFYSMDESDPNNCWQVITQADKRYLYNMGAKKYATISADGRITLTANKTAIEIKENDGGIIFGADTNHQWGFVKNTSYPDVTGIMPQTSITEKTANSYYSLDGQCRQSPRRGLNIVRMNDGTTKKIVVK